MYDILNRSMAFSSSVTQPKRLCDLVNRIAWSDDYGFDVFCSHVPTPHDATLRTHLKLAVSHEVLWEWHVCEEICQSRQTGQYLGRVVLRRRHYDDAWKILNRIFPIIHEICVQRNQNKTSRLAEPEMEGVIPPLMAKIKDRTDFEMILNRAGVLCSFDYLSWKILVEIENRFLSKIDFLPACHFL